MNTITSSHKTHTQVAPAHRRRRMRFWIGRVLLGLFALLLVLAATGVIYQALATAIDRRAFAPPGRLVVVDGRQMHISCTGQGSPTVVLEAGAGAPSGIWAWVQPEIAQQARVCAYDRAGLGWSEPGPHPRDAASVAQELHTLLQRAGESGPFVLAGHSLGGQYALMFAQRYPKETAGLVLIDAQHPDTLFRIPEAQAVYRQQLQQANMFVILSRLGIVRLLGIGSADPRLPADAQAALNMAKNTTDFITAYQAEWQAIPTSRDQLHAASDLGDLPLAVVSATEHGMPAELESYTMGLQRELAALSTNSRHDIVTGADHSSLVAQQSDSQRTVAAIRSIVALARGNK
jgi:pimeloyl-ACP methyl ester carboxylesterase